MDLQSIETFIKVAATQNLSRAAAQSGYSQSAVTVQIQKLEKELGVQLFERIGKRVYLTERGRAFIPYANELLKAAHSALTFSQGESKPAGVLRIGGVESICTALLPKLLLDFYRLCPEVEVVVRSGCTGDLLNLLGSNELDLVYTLDEKLCRPELSCQAEQKEEIIFTTLDSQLFRQEKQIPVDLLCKKPFILTETNAPYRCELEHLLAERGLSIHPILEIGNTETIINLLKCGMGLSFLPRFTVEDALDQHILMELHTNLPRVHMHHQLFFHRGKWITPQMQIFVQLVQDYLTQRTVPAQA